LAASIPAKAWAEPASGRTVCVVCAELITIGPEYEGDVEAGPSLLMNYPFLALWEVERHQTFLKTPNGKDLHFDVSLQCYLGELVKTKSSGMVVDSATASNNIRARVRVVDVDSAGNEILGTVRFAAPSAEPLQLGTPDGDPTFVSRDGVTYCDELLSLSAALQGALDLSTTACFDGNPVTTCTLTPEEIQLVLESLRAHAFNFVLPNVTSGIKKITGFGRVAAIRAPHVHVTHTRGGSPTRPVSSSPQSRWSARNAARSVARWSVMLLHREPCGPDSLRAGDLPGLPVDAQRGSHSQAGVVQAIMIAQHGTHSRHGRSASMREDPGAVLREWAGRRTTSRCRPGGS